MLYALHCVKIVDPYLFLSVHQAGFARRYALAMGDGGS